MTDEEAKQIVQDAKSAYMQERTTESAQHIEKWNKNFPGLLCGLEEISRLSNQRFRFLITETVIQTNLICAQSAFSFRHT